MIQNPVLRGFNPDPSILRVGDDYYIATSTFEWFPGVQIHHSADLVNWSLVARPLNRLSQLNLAGNANSGGVWAPCLSHHDGVFYLVYTDMKAWRGIHKEALNYVVTAPAIDGPWSDPVFLTGSGFDPSFYHENGRTYLVHMQWKFEHEIRPEGFDGIVIQEYDKVAKRLAGPKHTLMNSTPMGSMEGPHIYRYDDYYYLMTAEGGTEYGHAVTMGRSKRLFGPYELDPLNPMLSSRGHPELLIQKAGHASLVETQDGEWYLAHLCGRPVASPATGEKDRCILGRETALQKCCWKDGWLRLANGTNLPDEVVEPPSFLNSRDADSATVEERFSGEPIDHFDQDQLGIDYQSLRIPIDDHWCSWNRGRGLSLRGQGPLTSNHHQSIIARRIQSFNCEVETAVSFAPENYHQMAGLTAFYDTSTHYYLYVSRDPSLGRCLKLLKLDRGVHTLYEDSAISLPETGRVRLGAKLNINTLQFRYSADQNDQWQLIGPELDASILSDDHLELGFTGAFFGMAVQDLETYGAWADFPYFKYKETPEEAVREI